MRGHIFASDVDLSARYLRAAGRDNQKSRRSSLQPFASPFSCVGYGLGSIKGHSRNFSQDKGGKLGRGHDQSLSRDTSSGRGQGRASLISDDGKFSGARTKAHLKSDIKRITSRTAVDIAVLQRSGSQPLFVIDGSRTPEKFRECLMENQVDQGGSLSIHKAGKHLSKRINMIALPRTIDDTIRGSGDYDAALGYHEDYSTTDSNDVKDQLKSYKFQENRFTQSALNLVGAPSAAYLSHARSSDAVVHYNVLQFINGAGGAVSDTTYKSRYLKRHDNRSPDSIATVSSNHLNHFANAEIGSGSTKKEKIMRKKLLKRNTYSDLSYRLLQFQKFGANPSVRRMAPSAGNYATRSCEKEAEIDPVYLALKEATSKYGCNSARGGTASRRGSSVTFGNALDGATTPSPNNSSKVSLLDSGYGEAYNGSTHRKLIGSTPQLYERNASLSAVQQANQISPAASTSTGFGGICGADASALRRRPKLNQKMKSLSLDCAETIPCPGNSMFGQQLDKDPEYVMHDVRTSTDSLTSSFPHVMLKARLGNPLDAKVSHICTHDYIVKKSSGQDDDEASLRIGDRLCVVDNGDPDWLHGLKVADLSEQLLTFPKTCVAPLEPSEQPMKLLQNINIVGNRLRLYRDQVVFAQPDSMCQDNSIVIRTEHNAFAHCHIKYLALL